MLTRRSSGLLVSAFAVASQACGSSAPPPQVVERAPAVVEEPPAPSPSVEPSPASEPEPAAPAPTPTEGPTPSDAQAAEPPPMDEEGLRALLAAGPSATVSFGSPTYGELRGAVSLPERATGLLSNPRRPNSTAHFATYEMIRMLARAADRVSEEMPGGTLVVNDIGFEHGGPIDHHGSHQAGRDVDVLFYLLGADGAPIRSVGAPLDPQGEGHDYRDLLNPEDDVYLRLDAARTWRFVQAVLEDDTASVQRIFVVEHVRTLLLAEANRVNAPRAAIRRFEEVTCQPAYAHDDHLHIRLFCTAEDIAQGCEDLPPIYPWHEAELARVNTEVQLASVPRRRRSRVVTEAEARAAEPPMHESVRAFLDLRESWTTQPHPGRRYCR